MEKCHPLEVFTFDAVAAFESIEKSIQGIRLLQLTTGKNKKAYNIITYNI